MVGLRNVAAQAIDKPIIPSSTVTKLYRDAVLEFIMKLTCFHGHLILTKEGVLTYPYIRALLNWS